MSVSKQECKFANFPEGNTSECVNKDARNCVDKETNKGRGIYDCVCPGAYKLNNVKVPSSRGGKEPKITSFRKMGATLYNVSCK